MSNVIYAKNQIPVGFLNRPYQVVWWSLISTCHNILNIFLCGRDLILVFLPHVPVQGTALGEGGPTVAGEGPLATVGTQVADII